MAKIPVGIRVDGALLDRLRNAVWHLGKGLTMASVVSSGIAKELAKLEALNGGKPFPAHGRRTDVLDQFRLGKHKKKPPAARP
jgi:hypothetical protein